MKYQTEILCAVSILLCLNSFAAGFEINPVDSISNLQQTPDVDNGIVVWAEQVEGDWDIYGTDLLNPAQNSFSIAAFTSDQINPAIWNDRVVYQDYFFGDWDVYVSDISDANSPTDYLITQTEENYINDQIAPAIHGNTAAWQSYVVVDDGQNGTIEDWDIYAADITDPNNAIVYVVDEFPSDQQQPAVYRSKVVYQDNTEGDWDLWQTDVWLRNNPQYESVITTEWNQSSAAVGDNIIVFQAETESGDEDIYGRDMSQSNSEPFLIAGGPESQQLPDISGQLVVWQDDRNGNWDIYGYNLITGEEFQITTDEDDQTNPAINGTLVVWEDNRVTPANIYYTWLDGDIVADCPNQLAGDVDGDCRVNLTDFAQMAEKWLACGLDPVSACMN